MTNSSARSGRDAPPHAAKTRPNHPEISGRNPWAPASLSSVRTARKPRGYLANAARGNAPGVVVIQEWWGPAGPDQGLCDRFARGRLRCAGARPLQGHGGAVSRHGCSRQGNELAGFHGRHHGRSVRGAVQYLGGGSGPCQGGPDRASAAAATRSPINRRCRTTSGSRGRRGVVRHSAAQQAAKPADANIPLQAPYREQGRLGAGRRWSTCFEKGNEGRRQARSSLYPL